MDASAELTAPCPPTELYAWIDDLARYPSWTALIHHVERLPSDEGPSGEPGDPAWLVELRARIGPMTRSKRLRMVRTVHTPPALAIFERRELDGRRHSPWILTAHVDPLASGARLRIGLHYGGTLWTGGLLERALADQIERGTRRLGELVAGAG